MKAALVTNFDLPPRYEDVPTPTPAGPDEVLVDVVAAALSPRVRSQAAGSHYTSRDELPLIPGVDGVGRTPDGRLRYFLLPDTAMGAMAEHTLIDPRRSVALPDGVDPVAVAAGVNPVMSSWVALRRRADFAPGQGVLILGATGNAGRLAIQVARHLGAGRVVAVGRGAKPHADLESLGADAVVALDGDPDTVAGELARVGRDVDVVLDYLWGEPTAAALRAIVPARVDDSQRLVWVQIGSIAGPDSAIPSAALRATNLRVVGSGQGSVSTSDIRDDIADLIVEITEGSFALSTRAVRLSDVEKAWSATDAAERLVIVP